MAFLARCSRRLHLFFLSFIEFDQKKWNQIKKWICFSNRNQNVKRLKLRFELLRNTNEIDAGRSGRQHRTNASRRKEEVTEARVSDIFGSDIGARPPLELCVVGAYLFLFSLSVTASSSSATVGIISYKLSCTSTALSAAPYTTYCTVVKDKRGKKRGWRKREAKQSKANVRLLHWRCCKRVSDGREGEREGSLKEKKRSRRRQSYNRGTAAAAAAAAAAAWFLVCVWVGVYHGAVVLNAVAVWALPLGDEHLTLDRARASPHLLLLLLPPPRAPLLLLFCQFQFQIVRDSKLFH